MSSSSALQLVELIVSVSVAVASLELLYARETLQDDGLLSWRIHRLSHRSLVLVDRLPGLSKLFQYPGILLVVCLRIPVPLIIALSALAGVSTFLPTSVICLATICMTLRSPDGNDGSDQMASIVLITATLGEGIGTANAKAIALLFIGAQAALAYGTSGLLKVFEAGWHNGYFVVEVLKTGSFGDRSLCRYIEERPRVGRMLGEFVAWGDCAFALAGIAPPRLCLMILGMAALFHIGVARIMGLNTFFWSFTATFPAIFWVSERLYAATYLK